MDDANLKIVHLSSNPGLKHCGFNYKNEKSLSNG